MKFYKYWVKETATLQVNGEPQKSTCFGGSNISMEDARLNAKEKLQKVQARINGSSEQEEEYQVSIREEIITTIDEHNIITRNRYGALVLNSENTCFVDIDEPRLSFWQSLFGHGKHSKKELIIQMIEKKAAKPPLNALNYRIYETHSGIRLIISGKPLQPSSAESKALLKAFNSDWLYQILCVKQDCYRARLTPKPYRIKCKAHRVTFPRDQEQQSLLEQWVKSYEQHSAKFGVCKFVKQIGDEIPNKIIKFHDAETRAYKSIKLA